MLLVTTITLAVVAEYTYLANKQIMHSDRNYITQNRPYLVFAQFATIVKTFSGGVVGYQIGPDISNLGNTPAVGVSAAICNPISLPDDSTPNLVCEIDSKLPSDAVIGPRADQMVAGPVLTPQDLTDISGGKTFEYIFGEIKYRDTIGGTKIYTTRFCERIYGASITQTLSGLNVSWLAGECNDASWTCVDDSCPSIPVPGH